MSDFSTVIVSNDDSVSFGMSTPHDTSPTRVPSIKVHLNAFILMFLLLIDLVFAQRYAYSLEKHSSMDFVHSCFAYFETFLHILNVWAAYKRQYCKHQHCRHTSNSRNMCSVEDHHVRRRNSRSGNRFCPNQQSSAGIPSQDGCQTRRAPSLSCLSGHRAATL